MVPQEPKKFKAVGEGKVLAQEPGLGLGVLETPGKY